MKIATILFTYNRSYHTKQVINGLKENSVLPEKLYIFQDGRKEKDTDYEWNKVNKMIHSIDWCNKEVIVSKSNKGLAASIVSGIDYAFKEYDAVIILEDDCVPAPNFIRFMTQCFEKYRDEKKIYSVSGYSWPIDLPEADSDIYFCGRTSSWGWGTWKDRWRGYKKDYMLYKRLKQTETGSLNLAMWGRDVEDALTGKVTGRNDVWGLFWVLRVIAQEGLCINPYKSLIDNIGMDGTGVHCDVTNYYAVEIERNIKEDFCLIDDIKILDEVKEAFAALFGSYTAVNKLGKEKEKIIVYGLGNLFIRNEKCINNKYYIEAFIDNIKTGYFAGKPIIKGKDIGTFYNGYSKILIMIQDINESLKVSRELVCRYGVPAERIEVGAQYNNLISEYIDRISVLEDADWKVEIGKLSFYISNIEQFYSVYEVQVNKIYNYHIRNEKKDIVFEIGTNIGEAALFFIQNRKVEKIYVYELQKENVERLNKNLEKNAIAENKYEIFQGDIKTKDFLKVLEHIEDMYPNCNYILKMDVEAQEYEIIKNICTAGMLGIFHVIMLKWHDNKIEGFMEHVKKAGFSYWCVNKSEKFKMVYSIKD